jgi:hypothetical protein
LICSLGVVQVVDYGRVYLSELGIRISEFGEFFWRVVLVVHGVDWSRWFDWTNVSI